MCQQEICAGVRVVLGTVQINPSALVRDEAVRQPEAPFETHAPANDTVKSLFPRLAIQISDLRIRSFGGRTTEPRWF
jgi:hypothetical protein